MIKKSSLRGYIALICISLFLIFFVGQKVTPGTGETSWIVTSDGINHFKQGMDVAGGVRLTYKIDLSKYRELYPDQQEFGQITANVKDIILQNIDTRISQLGVSDYNSYIQSLSDGEYVVVEIGGVSDLDQAKEIIGKTVELEFKLQYEGDGADQRENRQLVAESLLQQAVANPELISELAENKEGDNIYYQHHQDVPLEELPEVYQGEEDIFATWEPGTVYPTLLEGRYVEGTDIQGSDTVIEGRVVSKFNGLSTGEVTDASGNVAVETYYDVEDILIEYTPSWITAKDPITNEILNGAFFKFANVQQSQTGQPVAIINFDEKGKEIFCNITSEIVGEQLAIFVGGEMVTAPVIREKICGGSAQIDGQFDVAGAKELVTSLNEGALPAPLILAHEEKVSATLGEQALTGAMIAGAVGLALIAAFMLSLYGFRKGSVAIVTLIVFLIVLFALMKLIGYALSLSGIAAILLSIGMGVDANVLIYERVTEEMQLDKSDAAAIEDGHSKSLSAIRDGNLTTFMIALLLFFMGTNVFKGFGTMMMVNIILTLAVIVPLTKVLLHVFYGSKKAV